ncbi:hypothetical protein, partial [Caldimonas sp.]|uniref:hypothetical protein n=1 Tax=Caldimonas sp. TaxID=2838790 RepID=UPI00307F3D36
NRPHVHVRLGPLKLAFCHVGLQGKNKARVGLRSPALTCHGQQANPVVQSAEDRLGFTSRER